MVHLASIHSNTSDLDAHVRGKGTLTKFMGDIKLRRLTNTVDEKKNQDLKIISTLSAAVKLGRSQPGQTLDLIVLPVL